jgi:hygromycin-B 7''-O-kinase
VTRRTSTRRADTSRQSDPLPTGTWTLSGLLDFECAMTGDRAYEFVAVGLLISRGDPGLLGRILAAYGHRFDPRELLACTLLHVHGNLPEVLRELPAPPEATLDSLAVTWFGTA